MVIKIEAGAQTIKSIDKPSDISITPDNRAELVKTIGGAILNSGWDGNKNSDIGDIASLSFTVGKDEFEKLKTISNNNTECTITLGEFVIKNAIVQIKNYSYNLDFPEYYKLSVEIWRIG